MRRGRHHWWLCQCSPRTSEPNTGTAAPALSQWVTPFQAVWITLILVTYCSAPGTHVAVQMKMSLIQSTQPCVVPSCFNSPPPSFHKHHFPRRQTFSFTHLSANSSGLFQRKRCKKEGKSRAPKKPGPHALAPSQEQIDGVAALQDLLEGRVHELRIGRLHELRRRGGGMTEGVRPSSPCGGIFVKERIHQSKYL